MTDRRTRAQAAQAFMRASATVLLAVVVGTASAGAGFIISAVGALATARRSRRIAADHRRRADLRLVQSASQERWDAQWDRWGGRLPKDGRR